eukprot:Platyproteum_vivax@DN6816_c0_g1_i4.p1
MAQKLTQMNQVIEEVATSMDDDTLLLVFGDHGQTNDGSHGGELPQEVNSALFMYSKKREFLGYDPHFASLRSIEDIEEIPQVDLVPTLSILLGVPIPFHNLGSFIWQALPAYTTDVRQLTDSLSTSILLNAPRLLYILSPTLLIYTSRSTSRRSIGGAYMSLLPLAFTLHGSTQTIPIFLCLVMVPLYFLCSPTKYEWITFMGLWALVTFLSTGHRFTINALPISAGFVGMQEVDITLATILTGIHILWPCGCAVLATPLGATLDSTNSNKSTNRKLLIGELSSWFLLAVAAFMLFVQVALVVLRRHLMVWSVFAPKFLYDGAFILCYHCLFSFFSAFWTLQNSNEKKKAS